MEEGRPAKEEAAVSWPGRVWEKGSQPRGVQEVPCLRHGASIVLKLQQDNYSRIHLGLTLNPPFPSDIHESDSHCRSQAGHQSPAAWLASAIILVLASRGQSSTDRKGGTTLHLCTRVEKGTGQIKGHLLSCAADSGLIAGTKSGLVEAPDLMGCPASQILC